MFKGIKALLVLSLFALLLAQPVSAAAKTVEVKVTLVRVELIENNHVGHEWYTTASVNGKELREGSTVTLKLKSTGSVKLEAYAEEQDKNTGGRDSGFDNKGIFSDQNDKQIVKGKGCRKSGQVFRKFGRMEVYIQDSKSQVTITYEIGAHDWAPFS
ncbi:hypothetical protein PACILC2_36640 [Paenibacillus cisolokensis]|uniref:Uncharacterized protein n=1 Tax=Paenibacillus cisolokensis TaxID=1658519 RepID=A0ABQ4NA87_9BACL|nr:hypothetical protein [Paenibacillus cisolokensis]GIQ65096.1 hypothetical protein PACILC2_36640 [Paenibacillus cisolokensis]